MDDDSLSFECPELDSFKNDKSSLDLPKCDSLNTSSSFSTTSKQHGEKSSTSALNQLSSELQRLSLHLISLEDNKTKQIGKNEKEENTESQGYDQSINREEINPRESATPPLDLHSLENVDNRSTSSLGSLQKLTHLDPKSFDDSSISDSEEYDFDLIDKLPSSDLSSSSLLRTTYTDADEYKGSRIHVRTLKNFANILTKRGVNMHTLANMLNRIGIVTQDCVQQLDNNGEESNEKCARILSENIENHVTTLQLVFVLHQNNFIQVAQDLFSFHMSFEEKSRCRDVSRKKVGERRKIQYYFKKIKQDVHRLFTSNPHAEVGEIGKRMLQEIEKEGKPGRRRFLYDKYICLKAAEIDAHTNQTDNVDPKGKPFQEIEAVIAESSCPEISLILMLGRQADISSSLGTSPDDGENFLVDAFMWQDMCERCIEATDMIYKSVVFYLLQFQRTKDKKYQRKLFKQAAIGLDSLSEESDDVRFFWSRLFRLRIIFCHLGIGKRGEIIEGYHVSSESLKVVERMFQEDKLGELEHRRKMMYGIAVARFCHLQGAIGKAKEIIDIVMDFAREGNYSEKGNVATYQAVLKNIDENMEEVVILSDEYLFNTISPIYSRQSSRSSTTDTNTSSEIVINQQVLFETSSSDGFENTSDSNGPPCGIFPCMFQRRPGVRNGVNQT